MKANTDLTRGAWAELLVSIDLLNQGFHVWRAVAGQAPVDLIIDHPERGLLRIEVKNQSSPNSTRHLNPTVSDHIAKVRPNGKIIYWTSLDGLTKPSIPPDTGSLPEFVNPFTNSL